MDYILVRIYHRNGKDNKEKTKENLISLHGGKDCNKCKKDAEEFCSVSSCIRTPMHNYGIPVRTAVLWKGDYKRMKLFQGQE